MSEYDQGEADIGGWAEPVEGRSKAAKAAWKRRNAERVRQANREYQMRYRARHPLKLRDYWRRWKATARAAVAPGE